jgi:hypothetical protein
VFLPAFVPLAVERLTFKAVLTNEAPVKIVSIMLSTRLPICEAVEVTCQNDMMSFTYTSGQVQTASSMGPGWWME